MLSMNKLTSVRSFKLFLLNLCISGVLCQSFSSPGEICPGDDVTFTCVVVDPDGDSFTTWIVTLDGGEQDCILRHNRPNDVDTCGPGQAFTASLTNRSGDNYTSTLRVESISDGLNDTRVECENALQMDVGMENICIIDDTSVDPQSIIASISVPDLCDNTACMVNVRWSEPFVGCEGSVSHYLLSVTPPTADCQSGSDNSGSEFMTNETHYDLTVIANQTYILNISVNNSCGDIGQAAEYIIDFGGVTTTCNYSYIYNVTSLGIQGINVTWQRDVLNEDVHYRVVIIPGSGNEMVFNDSLIFNCTGDSCSYTFSSDGITDSYSGAVKVVRCVTNRTECTNISSLCDPKDLLVDLPPDTSGTWSPLISGQPGYSFSGGNVTFDGISEGSTATYTTHGDYFVSDRRFFQTTCRNGSWIPLPTITVTPRFNLRDLLPEPITRNCSKGLCVRFNGTSVGDIATYFTTPHHCINRTSELTRVRQNDGSWSGSVPGKLEVCNDAQLLSVHITLIVIGVIVYISGICVATSLGVVLFKKASSCIDVALAVVILGTSVISLPPTIILCCILYCVMKIWNIVVKGDSLKKWYQTLIVVVVVITILSFVMWLIMIIIISINDFCEKHDHECSRDSVCKRRDDSVCEPPKGDNGARTGLVVGSLLSSVLVLLVWIVPVLLHSRGVIINKPPPKPQRSTSRGMSWEGEEKQELKEVVSEPTTPPLATDDSKPDPDDDTGGVSSFKSPTSSGPDDTKPKEAVPKSDSKPKKSGSKPKKSGSKPKKSAPKPKEPDPDDEDAQYDVVVKPSHPEPETEEAKEKLKEKRPDGVHYGKLDHGVTVRPHAASVSSAPPVPSPTDHEEYSRLRGHQPGQTYGKLSRVADSGPEYGKLDTSQVAKPGASGDMYDVVHSDQLRHVPRPREEQTQPIPGIPGDLYTEVRNEPLHVPQGQPKGPYESGEDHSTLL